MPGEPVCPFGTESLPVSPEVLSRRQEHPPT